MTDDRVVEGNDDGEYDDDCYVCVVCQKALFGMDGQPIIHDDIPHPILMFMLDVYDEERWLQ